MRSKIQLAVAGCSVLCLAGLAGLSVAHAQMDDGKKMDDMKMSTVEVTITNLTKGQPFAPPILVTHAPGTHLFEVGKMASPAMEKLAETGMSDELKAMTEGKVSAVAAAKMDEKIMPGKSFTMKLTCKPGDVISGAMMVAASNDTFTGFDSVALDKMMMDKMPADAGMKDDGMKKDGMMMMKDGVMTMMVMAYDAGTEENTEKKSDTAAPDMGMGHPATTPPQPITMSKGIMGTGDLDKAMFGWEGPVAKIEIKMVK